MAAESNTALKCASLMSGAEQRLVTATALGRVGIASAERQRDMHVVLEDVLKAASKYSSTLRAQSKAADEFYALSRELFSVSADVDGESGILSQQLDVAVQVMQRECKHTLDFNRSLQEDFVEHLQPRLDLWKKLAHKEEKELVKGGEDLRKRLKSTNADCMKLIKRTKRAKGSTEKLDSRLAIELEDLYAQSERYCNQLKAGVLKPLTAEREKLSEIAGRYNVLATKRMELMSDREFVEESWMTVMDLVENPDNLPLNMSLEALAETFEPVATKKSAFIRSETAQAAAAEMAQSEPAVVASADTSVYLEPASAPPVVPPPSKPAPSKASKASKPAPPPPPPPDAAADPPPAPGVAAAKAPPPPAAPAAAVAPPPPPPPPPPAAPPAAGGAPPPPPPPGPPPDLLAPPPPSHTPTRSAAGSQAPPPGPLAKASSDDRLSKALAGSNTDTAMGSPLAGLANLLRQRNATSHGDDSGNGSIKRHPPTKSPKPLRHGNGDAPPPPGSPAPPPPAAQRGQPKLFARTSPGGAPPPPPPAATANAARPASLQSTPGRSGLLGEIRKGKRLKHVSAPH